MQRFGFTRVSIGKVIKKGMKKVGKKGKICSSKAKQFHWRDGMGYQGSRSRIEK